MRDLVSRALDTASQRGAAYADVRIVERRASRSRCAIRTSRGSPPDESLGFGVRVIVDGYWGFAGSYRMTPEEADHVAAKAVAIARASARAGGPKADIGPPEVHIDTYRTPFRIDPFAVSLDDKIALLLRANEAMTRVKSIVMAESNVYYQREKKTFGSSEGSFIEQELVETGCGIEATAVDEGEVQQRSYPNSVGRHQGTEGWEFVERYDLAGNAGRVAEEAAALLTREALSRRRRRRSSSTAASWRSRSTRAAATPSSWTACWGRRRPSPARAS